MKIEIMGPGCTESRVYFGIGLSISKVDVRIGLGFWLLSFTWIVWDGDDDEDNFDSMVKDLPE